MRWFAVLAVVVACPLAHAHDLYESWTAVAVRPDGLALNLTLAQATALQLVDSAARIHELTPENFAAVRPAFAQAARELYVLTAASTALAPRSVEVELTDEGDIAFRLRYPPVAAGALKFHATFLRRLGEGYTSLLAVDAADGKQLGWDQLTTENPDLEVRLPGR